MSSTPLPNIPTDAAVVLLGGDATDCVLIERKLKSLGLSAIKRFDRGTPVLTMLEGRELDLIYLVGSPIDMDSLTFVRAARSARIPAGVAIYFVWRPTSKLLDSEKEFLKAYNVQVLKTGLDDEKILGASLGQVFQDRSNRASLTSRLEAAKRLLRDGLTGWASKVYQEILSEDAINITARVGLMRASAANPEIYWQQLQKLLAQDPKNFLFKFEQIDRLMQEGRAEDAGRLLDEVLAQLREDAEIFWLVELGVICVSERLFPFCFKIVEMIREKARKDQMWQADLLESRTHLASGTVDEATRFLAEAVRLAPGPRAEIENMKAILARKRGNFQAAASCYEEALRISPEDHRIAFNLGLCHEHTGSNTQALAAYKMALSLSPSYARAQAKVDELQSRLSTGNAQ